MRTYVHPYMRLKLCTLVRTQENGNCAHEENAAEGEVDQTNENNEQHRQHQAELKARAKTDEQARATLTRTAEKRRENCRKRRALKRERMANDPAYAEQER